MLKERAHKTEIIPGKTIVCVKGGGHRGARDRDRDPYHGFRKQTMGKDGRQLTWICSYGYTRDVLMSGHGGIALTLVLHC